MSKAIAKTEVSFKTSNEENDLIRRIVDRALGLRIGDRMSITMDVIATHANGNPLRLADLLAADDFNFAHDMYGINRHLNRETGKLEDFFSPRFTRQEKTRAA